VSSRIRITGMRFWGVHGTLEDERTHAQPIDVDVEIEVDVEPAARSDALADTFDYRAAYRICERIVTGRSFALLEALASAAIEELLSDPRVKRATVRMRKPRALDGATPEVELARDNARARPR
jgi:7,8-dihydroneopterin aldolase/epimerase/oxygenase